MPTKHSLLQNALILDTETTGLTRGSGIHELAIYDLEQQSVHDYFLKPNYVETYTNPLQEHTKLASSPLDRHISRRPERWMDVLRAQLVMDRTVEKTATDQRVMTVLKQHNPFLWRAINKGKHPHLEGKALDPRELKKREEFFKSRGLVYNLVSQQAAVEDVLGEGGGLAKALRGGKHKQGRTVWIANAAFEAKQIGAQLGGMGAEAAQSIKGMLETASGSPDPFYVTGKAVNIARVQAQMTGDWTGVYRAYKSSVPKAGEVAVRDIQDVLRSMMSYGKSLGLVGFDDPYFGTSMDLSSRIFGSLDPNRAKALSALVTPEVHRAAEDVAITENYVLRQALKYTDVLQEVAEDSPLGKKYQALAQREEGPLAEIAKYFARIESLRPEIQEQNLIKRLVRAEQDFLEQGRTWQRTGINGITVMKQVTPSGTSINVPRLDYTRKPFDTRESFVEYLTTEGRYENLDIAGQMTSLQDYINGADSKFERKRLLSQYLNEKTSGVIDGKIAAQAEMLVDMKNRRLGTVVSRFKPAARAAQGVVDAMSQMKPSSLIKGWGGLAGGLAIAGSMWSMAAGNAKPARETPSMVSFNYHEWLQQQEEFYGQRSQYEQTQGMHDSGLAGMTRKLVTDFGSPYQGIQGSQVVFAEQELLQEREKWLREQYGAKHFDPEVGLFGAFGPFKSTYRKGYSYIGGGTSVAQGTYGGLKGDLLQINLRNGDWKIKVEDADTIVLKKGGVRGAVASFFGMNRGYSFRLAGIDAPETSHGSTSYHAPQPGAEAAKVALNNLVRGSNDLTLVYDPSQTTYGRMMGAVIADGKNLNFEMVKRGMVAHLPYGKSEDSMIDYQTLKAAEARAHSAGRGIWALPYYKAFHDVSNAANQRVTFNTLTSKDKIVQNAWKMDMLGLMEQSQAQGFYSTANAMEATRIGGAVRGHMGPDQVRPVLFDQNHSHYNTYLNEMLRDLGTWNKSHGSKTMAAQNKFSQKGNYGKLDRALVLDSMGSTSKIFNKRRLQSFDNYGSGDLLSQTRKARMAMEQRRISQQFFDSPINHHQM